MLNRFAEHAGGGGGEHRFSCSGTELLDGRRVQPQVEIDQGRAEHEDQEYDSYCFHRFFRGDCTTTATPPPQQMAMEDFLSFAVELRGRSTVYPSK